MAARGAALVLAPCPAAAPLPRSAAPRRRCRGPRRSCVSAIRASIPQGNDGAPEAGVTRPSGRRALLFLAAAPALRCGSALAASAEAPVAPVAAALSPLRTPLSVSSSSAPFVSLSWFSDLLRRGDVAEAFFADGRTLAFRTRRPVADYEFVFEAPTQLEQLQARAASAARALAGSGSNSAPDGSPEALAEVSALLSSPPPRTVFRAALPGPPDAALLADMRAAGVPYAASSFDADAFNDKLEAGVRLSFLVGLGYILLTSDAGGVGTLLKRPARLYEGGQGPSGITFADVAGCDEAKAELAEVVDFLKAPSRYKALGARVPRGVMLVGPPGTGKTLLAKAVAGEAGTPFFAASASEFVELYVGLGGRRIRSLFAEARKRAPCVIFIDELDAVGRARAAGTGANVAGVANEEREQTLNQLLTEMDGFEAAADAPPVIVLAATNRPDALDAALKRPGRFDRTVAVAAPDRAGRAAILRVHMRKLGPAAASAAEAIADDVAAVTTGMTGAELANVVNEAALLAARRGGDAVSLADFAAAAERAVAGLERRSLRVSASERRIVALHEAGHAIVAALCPEEGGAKVNKVSIVPRASGALGVTLRDPGDDRFLATELALRSALATLMGGRAAERVAVGALTSGASDDIRRATAIATDMVTNYGMCPAVGPRAVATAASAQMAMPPPPPGAALAATVDTEVAALLRGADDWAVAAVSLNLGLVTEMATTLLAEEALGGSQLAAYLARAQAPDGFAAWLATGRGAAPDAAASISSPGAGQAAGNGRHS